LGPGPRGLEGPVELDGAAPGLVGVETDNAGGASEVDGVVGDESRRARGGLRPDDEAALRRARSQEDLPGVAAPGVHVEGAEVGDADCSPVDGEVAIESAPDTDDGERTTAIL